MGPIGILVGDRHFVKIENGKETDINAHDLKPGDRFALYEFKCKRERCHWDDVTEFICDGPVYANDEGVERVPCLLTED